MSNSDTDWPEWLPHPLWNHTCPRCDSMKLKQAERRPFDGFLAIFAMRPVRCMFCWRRYYWLALHAEIAE